MNYLTPAELLNYYDKRRVYELASDTGAPVTDGTYTTNTIVLTAIRNASSHVDSAVQTGQRYERTQLEDIVTASNAGGASDAAKSRAEPIKALVAHLAFAHLATRRGYAADSLAKLAPMYATALEQLNQLASGVRILDVDGPKAAGVPIQVRLGSSLVNWVRVSPMFGYFPSSAGDTLWGTGGY